MASIALGKSVEKKNVSFEEIWKVLKLVNIITNKRVEKSEIITSSPYKKKLKKTNVQKLKKLKRKLNLKEKKQKLI